MATSTTKLGLSKPAPLELVDVVDDLGNQFDRLDTAIGVTWVADGGTPTLIYHGLHIKELTSLKEFIYKNDGSGGYTKVATTNPTWTDVVFQPGFTTQAGYPKPQYRVVGGMAQWRGVIRHTGALVASIDNIINCPVPAIDFVAGTQVHSTYMRAICSQIADASTLGGFVILNPRNDGVMRVYNQGYAASGNNLITLDGLQYAA